VQKTNGEWLIGKWVEVNTIDAGHSCGPERVKRAGVSNLKRLPCTRKGRERIGDWSGWEKT